MAVQANGSLMIKHSTFTRGHALSFRQQPYLHNLFDAVRDTGRPLTLVVGAGVSISAGLPSWTKLIFNMADSIKNPRLREMARRDTSDPMRKAEIILNLIKSESPSKPESEIIRDALYQRDLRISVGQLATSIARLVAARRKTIRLLTTNFDSVLEVALREHYGDAGISHHSLGDVEGWENSLYSDGIGVLHLHGLVRQGANHEEPIILTESQFLKYGASVRKVISNNLKDSTTIFIGLSMSDPNLIGPLYESSKDGISVSDSRFALVVPESVPGADSGSDSAEYAISAARYLESKLGLRSIFLKSYSQLNQVVSDLSLAVLEPIRYNNRSSVRVGSLVYGRRMTKALDDCYRAIGCEKSNEVPTGIAGKDLNDQLYRALHARRGPVDVLKGLARVYGDYKIGGPGGENYALFLWLRSRERRAVGQNYSLTLVGTSAYIHREEWSIRRDVPIVRDSTFAAVQSVFEGTLQTANLPPVPPLPIWQGVVAMPIFLAGTGSNATISGFPADVLTIGAITLNATHLVVDKPVRGDDSPVDRKSLSIISHLDSSDLNTLLETLKNAAGSILASKRRC